MAQLIKLQDFISRYETDIYRYPSQFIRLKKERWEKINASLDDQQPKISDSTFFEGFDDFDQNWLEPEKKGLFGTIKHWLKKSKGSIEDINENETPFREFNQISADRRKTKAEIKQEFLNELFRFQINWASSTIRDYSYVDQNIYNDELLKYFLQHFPDNYLLLYKPTLLVKKAPIELEVILISPVTTFCITVIESDDMSVFKTDRGNYWSELIEDKEIKRINPMHSLNRAESLIKGYYKHYEVEMPVQKIVLSRTGFIEGEYEPSNTLLIDKRNYSEWYTKLRRLPSPIKFVQLKGAQALLRHSQSAYVRRYEWEQEEDEIHFDEFLDEDNLK
ncbi:MAG TPA: NERD domain-containing protein [Bacillales bacterium]|nr:NERD domain-containing protein [Bacillales bacterium]